MFEQRRKLPEQKVTTGRLEIEQDGHVAYLEYTVAGNVLGLVHTEVPKELRGKGLASELAKAAFEWAREHEMKVDVICPSVADFLDRHKEYSDLVLRRTATRTGSSVHQEQGVTPTRIRHCAAR
jgi:predicted GNAT family acetyltransferase